jgi:multidrug efflux pump subunit AcrA (membrane-fusion protein)
MKMLPLLACGLILGFLTGCESASPAADAPATTAQPVPAAALEVLGRTRCPLNRRGIIAPAILRPVVEVLVSPGDRVKKGQVLVKLFDLEPQAKLMAREKDLNSIEARALYSRRILDNAETAHHNGAMPENTYNEVRSTAMSNEAQRLAAQAELALVQAELKLYSVTASIDGEVAWLDVSPGTVTWPGALIWGEIVDLRELDVRCELSPVQAEQVAVGESAEVWLDGKSSLSARWPTATPAASRLKSAWRTLRSGCARKWAPKSASERKRRNDRPPRSAGKNRSHFRGLAGRPGPGSPGLDHPDTGRPGPAAPGGRGGIGLALGSGCTVAAPARSESSAMGAGGCGFATSSPSNRIGTCVSE